MSSPNHPTSNIKDSFSSNFPDYIPAFSNYVSALPRKTCSSSSNNSFGLVTIATPTLSLFHDDPYMKFMQAYYAKESPIPPPTIVSSSSMLSPKFNPQEFSLPEELLPLKKRMSLPTSPLLRPTSKPLNMNKALVCYQADKESLLDAIYEHKNNQEGPMPPTRTSTSEASAMTQAAIKKLVANSVSTALEVQAANMANTDNTTRPREDPVARKCSYKEFMSCQPINFKDCKVKFATGTLTEEALSWWNSFAQPIGIEEAYKITWVEFKKLLKKKYCPRTEV
ncbi:hypothetical protein Tco_0366370 [Tanacetum coccineum]